MLSIGRKKGESVVINGPGGTIRIVASKVKGNKVQLVFDAPQCYRIMRSELLHPVKCEGCGADVTDGSWRGLCASCAQPHVNGEMG